MPPHFRCPRLPSIIAVTHSWSRWLRIGRCCTGLIFAFICQDSLFKYFQSYLIIPVAQPRSVSFQIFLSSSILSSNILSSNISSLIFSIPVAQPRGRRRLRCDARAWLASWVLRPVQHCRLLRRVPIHPTAGACACYFFRVQYLSFSGALFTCF